VVKDAVSFGVPEDREEIMRAKLLVLGLRAQGVLRNALCWKRADDKEMNNAKAVTNAGKVREEVTKALDFGVLVNDPALEEARAVASDIHGAKVLRAAQAEKAEDASSFESGLFRSGDAMAAAERIEMDIRDATSVFVPANHPALEEATGICKFLREQEGLRKRMRYAEANRQK